MFQLDNCQSLLGAIRDTGIVNNVELKVWHESSLFFFTSWFVSHELIYSTIMFMLKNIKFNVFV